jgi:protein-S-isoprenylcysteine O-methyltransferase Ste14
VGLYPNHALVTTGPYRLIRHPIYLAFIAIMCLVFVLSANWLLGLSGLLLVGSIAIARIPIEERELHERFGMSWQTYQEQTGKFFPRVRR